MSEYRYFVYAEKNLRGLNSNKINDYILGAWETRMPDYAMEYWSGHGQAFGFRKLTWKNIFKGRRHRSYIKSYDVSFDVSTLEEGKNLLASLQHLTKDDGVTVRLGVYPTEEH